MSGLLCLDSATFKALLCPLDPVAATTATTKTTTHIHQSSRSQLSTHAVSCVTAVGRLGRLVDGCLRLTTILGAGAYGVVYSAIDINTTVRYAVKCLSKLTSEGAEPKETDNQQREIRLHCLVSAHPNIIPIHKIVNDPDCIFIILEYCPEGDLFVNITEHEQYVGHDELSKRVYLQILGAVEHCHHLQIYHRDLKPENILVTDHGYTVKLCDFGLATSDVQSDEFGCGSSFYMSPESLKRSTGQHYYMCAPCDVWSLGIILVNLTCGSNPWAVATIEDSAYQEYRRSEGFLKSILPLSDDMNDILRCALEPNPELRVTVSELRNMVEACSTFTVPAVHVLLPL